jgi:hypothetical protein
VTEQTNADTDRLLFYGEPTPESVGPLQRFLDQPGAAFQKVILMSSEARIQEVRPLAIAALEDRASLTTALPGMLEARAAPTLLCWPGCLAGLLLLEYPL